MWSNSEPPADPETKGEAYSFLKEREVFRGSMVSTESIGGTGGSKCSGFSLADL